jgi:hypothetical protein
LNQYLQPNRQRLSEFENWAQASFNEGDFESALEHASSGAKWSWDHHPGEFASAKLEKLLRRIGRKYAPTERAKSLVTLRPRVLHILTEAYPTGGHTRLTWRWIEIDTARDHTVLLTQQIATPVPAALVNAAKGNVVELTGATRIERLKELSLMLSNYDLIVLNIHPHDSVAVAACSGSRGRPRTVLVNHADHVFWLGVGATDQILNFRPSSVVLTKNRRCRAKGMSDLLPLPLDTPLIDPQRGEALRVELAIPANAPVSLCLSAPYKFTDDIGGQFLRLLRRALVEQPDLHHIAIGPGPGTLGWAELASEFPERLHLFDVTPDYQAAFDAADIFLDSFPFSSITSALEAACWALPVLSLGAKSPSPLTLDDLGLRQLLAQSEDEWIATLQLWATNRTLAAEVGRRHKHDCEVVHEPTAWLASLERILATGWKRRRRIMVPKDRGSDQIDVAIEQLSRTRLSSEAAE